MRDTRTQRRAWRLVVVAAVVLMATLLPAAQKVDRKAVEETLNNELKGQVVYLKAPFTGLHMKFDRDGNPLDAVKDDFLLANLPIEIRDIKVKKNRYEIHGEQVCVQEGESEGETTTRRYGTEIQFDLQAEPDTISHDDFGRLAGRILGTMTEERIPHGCEPVDAPPHHHVGKGVSAPTCVSCPDPEYTDEARLARANGIVLLWAVVDTTGQVSYLRILRGLGKGLDAEAIRTVRSYRLQPAVQDGKPVPVGLTIEIKFEIH